MSELLRPELAVEHSDRDFLISDVRPFGIGAPRPPEALYVTLDSEHLR